MITINVTKSEGILFLSIIAIFIIMFSCTLQFIVMKENGGLMPVKCNSRFIEKEHFGFIYDKEVNHPLLADRFRLGGYIYSIGDFFLLIGCLLFSMLIIYWVIYKAKFERSDGNY